jgi:hypothetical protein
MGGVFGIVESVQKAAMEGTSKGTSKERVRKGREWSPRRLSERTLPQCTPPEGKTRNAYPFWGVKCPGNDV